VLAFVRTTDSGWGIHAVNADGSQERRLIYHNQALAYPDWSPSGAAGASQVIFHKHQSDQVWSIYVIDEDGGNERRLSNADAQDAAPVWSPDGARIAFSRDGDIWLMNADGSEPRLLVDDPEHASGLDWSPDGSRIVFESNRDGDSEIYLVDADGSSLKQLTTNQGEDWWPVWSPAGAPGGEQIAFMSDRDGDMEIYVMNTNGGNVRQLTYNEVDDSGPAWSPDGTRIAFASNRDTGLPFDSDIYIMNADGSDPQRITEKAGMEWGIDWRPGTDQDPDQAETADQTGSDQFPDLRITILADNYLHDERLALEWGFSALVEYGEHVLLFDTSGPGGTMLQNMALLGIDPASIDTVVISHEHGDHTGGLIPLLEAGAGPTVYLLGSTPDRFKREIAALAELVEVSEPVEIVPGLYTTGEVTANPPEQGLVIRTGSGTVVLTGCAHPGIVRMVRRGQNVVQLGSEGAQPPVALVVGGYHRANDSAEQVQRVISSLRSLGVLKVCPTHCTGDLTIALFEEAFGEDYVRGGAGQVISIP
jgi:7,8-dihydropterin-6-yl-methyl-4-(beta-D-ribofuranosyl)aminobenzene 5'-phosphate synthase